MRREARGFYQQIAGEGEAPSQLSKSIETESEPPNCSRDVHFVTRACCVSHCCLRVFITRPTKIIQSQNGFPIVVET